MFWIVLQAPIFKGGQSNKGEMVKTVINLDELSNKNAKSITGDVKESKTSTSTVSLFLMETYSYFTDTVEA